MGKMQHTIDSYSPGSKAPLATTV